MAEKRLAIVVDGTAAMGPYWGTIVSDYLEKIIRHFCGQSMGQESSGQMVELGVVMYKARGPHGTGCLVQLSSWTRDMERFLEWLLAFTFDGGGHDEAAIAEGLADALVMFPKLPNGGQAQQDLLGERHCILVAASNPFPLPMPLHLPKINNSQFSGAQTDWCVADSKTVAGLFTQYFVSLSVISPKQLPKLREVYNAGNENHKGPDPSLDNVKNPQFLVLLSEKFLEAHSALDEHETMNSSSSNNAVTKGTNSLPSHSDVRVDLSDRTFLQQIFDDPCMDQRNIPAGNISTETTKGEPKAVSSVKLQPAFPQHWCLPPQGFPTTSSPTASPSFNTQKNIKHEDIMVEPNPRGKVLSQNKNPAIPIKVYGSSQGEFVQPPQVMISAAKAGENSRGHSSMSIVKENPHTKTSKGTTQSAPNTSKLLCTIANASGNTNNFKPAGIGTMRTEKQGSCQSNGPPGVTSLALAGTPANAQNTAGSIFTSLASNIYGSFKISQPESLQTMHAGIQSPHLSVSPITKSEALLVSSKTAQNTTAGLFTSRSSNISGNLRTLQSRASQGYLSGARMEHNGVGWNQESVFGQSSISSCAGTSVSMIEMPQHTCGVTEISASTIDLEYKHDRYLMAWEGAMSAKYHGQLILVSRVRAYRKTSAAETLTADWPRALQIGPVIAQHFINKIPYDGHADYMIFEAFNNHKVYEDLRERELCVRINLPSQTLIFTPTDHKRRFIGTLFPGDFPLFKSCLSSLQQFSQQREQQNDQATADASAESQITNVINNYSF